MQEKAKCSVLRHGCRLKHYIISLIRSAKENEKADEHDGKFRGESCKCLSLKSAYS